MPPVKNVRAIQESVKGYAKHLDGDDPVEPLPGVEVVRIRGHDLDVRHATRLDERPLRARVRDGEDAARGVALGEVEGE